MSNVKLKQDKKLPLPTQAQIDRTLESVRRNGLPVSGLELAPGPIIKVLFSGGAQDSTDALLEKWMKDNA